MSRSVLVLLACVPMLLACAGAKLQPPPTSKPVKIIPPTEAWDIEKVIAGREEVAKKWQGEQIALIGHVVNPSVKDATFVNLGGSDHVDNAWAPIVSCYFDSKEPLQSLNRWDTVIIQGEVKARGARFDLIHCQITKRTDRKGPIPGLPK